jgi:hypothetical protein
MSGESLAVLVALLFIASQMRSDSTGAPPGLSIDRTTALTLEFENAFSKRGRIASADARSLAPIVPSILTTPTTLPNGPQRKPVVLRKKRK